MSKTEDKNELKLNSLLKSYLDENVKGYSISKDVGELELEVRFNRGKKVTQIQYENTIKRLLNKGFELKEPIHLLRIGLEYLDEKTGSYKQSSIRVELEGLTNISEYCRSDNLNTDENMSSIKFTQKNNYKSPTQGYIDPIDYNNFGFRIAFQTESNLDLTHPLTRNIVSQWNNSKKTFRYITRHRMIHPDFPVNIDLSIVKESKRRGYRYIPEYTFRASGVLDSYEVYEIEIEIDNGRVGIGTEYDTHEKLNIILKKAIKFILSGLQDTNYPVSYDEQNMVAHEYNKLLWGDKDKPTDRIKLHNKNFVGPSSLTLQLQNISEPDEDNMIPNIRTNYTVTDKADGDRKMLYIANNGKIYLIDTNMNIQFTGVISKRNEYYNTLIDGEHILHNKHNDYINLFACFDIYYINGKDIRSNQFTAGNDDLKSKPRLTIMGDVIKNLNIQSVLRDGNPSLRIVVKSFYSSSEANSIFVGCNTILKKNLDGVFEYTIDGLIFTPALLGVGANIDNIVGKPLKKTWPYCIKWKPEKDNTIDFLVMKKKNTSGQDYVGNIFEDGTNLSTSTQILQYKTLILHVGFNEKIHGYVNPCQNVIDDNIQSSSLVEDNDDYRPMQFYPTNPEDKQAGICNIVLKSGKNREKVMLTENNEVIEENMIVEFRYEMNKENHWKWVPLRVRYDKTADLRNGSKNYGNAFHVANSNWHTIHNPITEQMITTGKDIPEVLTDDDIYYNRVSKKTYTQGLRNFHNLYVKRKLIMSVSKRGGTLIDFSVGKGGDIPKWIAAKLKFVFGIDISRDNIENRLDGACARYLNNRKKFERMFRALFVVGNSSVNIRNTDAIFSDKSKQITKAVFGSGAKDVKQLGKTVYDNFGVGSNGFDVGSVQFAIHYMFENQLTLQNFLRNVSECIKVDGYFIGTCYDGETIFNYLKTKSRQESIIKTCESKKIWEVIKDYDYEEFNPDHTSVGYAIDVFQETINKTFKEYLVNYEYLKRLMEDYGFAELTDKECQTIGLKSSSALFDKLFDEMTEENVRYKNAKKLYGDAINMTDLEKQISFLNRYFIFKKVRDVDTSKVYNAIVHTKVGEIRDDILLEREDEKLENEKAESEKVESEKVESEKGESIKVKSKKKKKLGKFQIKDN